MNKIKTIFSIALLSMLFGMNATAEGQSLEDAFKNGKVKGQAAVYYEVFDVPDNSDNSQDGDSFAVATLKLKYETAKWNNLKFGAEAFAASQLYDHGGEFGGDFDRAGDSDNTLAALSEIYLKYYFSEKSFVQAGRWSHKKVGRGHLEDKQSEGFNIQFNDVEGLSVNAGLITQTAEFDYDDFEDWGDGSGTGDADFNDADYGDADPYLLFIDAEYAISDNITINPYLYYQGDFATVVGSDLAVEGKLSDSTKVGFDATAHYTETDGDLKENSGSGSYVAGILPWVKLGDLKLGTGVTHMSEGVVRPRWFNDYITDFDQENQYPGGANASGDDSTEALTAVQGTVEYKFKNFKVRYGIQQWDGEAEELEQELIFGYKFTKKFSLSLRLFDVDTSEGADDYQKIEARLRYKF